MRVAATVGVPPSARRRRLHLWALYARAILREFRGSLALLGGLIVIGTAVIALSSWQPQPGLRHSFAAAFELLSGEPLLGPPPNAAVTVLYVAFPIAGLAVGAEALVRLSLLLFSKRHGQKEWAKIMASTLRDHVVLCGLGHLGVRVLEKLLELGVDVVVIERDANNGFVETARARKVPVLELDAKNETALAEAGVPHARAIIVCTNDVMTNLEVAVDARKLNPKIRLVTRMFDPAVAAKLGDALALDVAFSSSALAAPTVATAIFDANVLSSFELDGRMHLVARVEASKGGALAGKAIAGLQSELEVAVLALERAAGGPSFRPSPDEKVQAGDAVVVHVRADKLGRFTSAARG